MKSFALAVLLIFLALVMISCSSSQNTPGELKTMQGRIYAIGNEPFVHFGLENENGKMYPLKAGEETTKMFALNQGKMFIITYSGIEDGPDGKMLIVVKAELVQHR